MRTARRFAALITAVFAFFAIVGTTAGTAFAETPTTSSPLYTSLPNGDEQLNYNTYESYGWCYDEASDTSYWGTCTNGYDGLDADNGGWDYNCYQLDCGQITVTGFGVSADKRSDFRFISGYYDYQYLDEATGQDIYLSGSWGANQVLPFFKTATVDGKSYKLQLTNATAYYYRDGLPLQTLQVCSDTTSPCKGGGMK